MGGRDREDTSRLTRQGPDTEKLTGRDREKETEERWRERQDGKEERQGKIPA